MIVFWVITSREEIENLTGKPPMLVLLLQIICSAVTIVEAVEKMSA